MTTDYVCRMWAAFCCAEAERPLPMTHVESDEEAGTTIIVHTVDDGAHPIQCRDGQVVRRLALTFEHSTDDTEWS